MVVNLGRATEGSKFCAVIGPLVLPPAYDEWNRKWHAPHGRTVPSALRKVPDLWRWRTRYAGPFGFQANNSTRRFEYPWAYHAVPIRAGMVAVDLGGGVSGFPFTIASAGASVVNVDPFLDYGSSVDYCDVDPALLIDRLNQVQRTAVRLVRRDLVGAALPAGSVDVVYCISMLEHLGPEARAEALGEVGRILKPGGHLVLTVDLFLDLAPFTHRATNRYGTNVDVSEVVDQSGLSLVAGRRAELFGYPEFDAEQVQSRLAEYLIGAYPAVAQCLVLARPTPPAAGRG